MTLSQFLCIINLTLYFLFLRGLAFQLKYDSLAQYQARLEELEEDMDRFPGGMLETEDRHAFLAAFEEYTLLLVPMALQEYAETGDVDETNLAVGFLQIILSPRGAMWLAEFQQIDQELKEIFGEIKE